MNKLYFEIYFEIFKITIIQDIAKISSRTGLNTIKL